MPSKDLDIQLKGGFFHTLGRVITQDSNNISNEKYKSSHNINSNELWVDDVPYASNLDAAEINADDIVVKQHGYFNNQVYLYPLSKTNYQTWFIDNGTPEERSDGFYPSVDWAKSLINPSDVSDVNGAPSGGYSLLMWSPSGGEWGDRIPYDSSFYEVDYFAGLIRFDVDRTPIDSPFDTSLGFQFDNIAFEAAVDKTAYINDPITGGPRVIAFQYVGERLDTSLQTIDTSLVDINQSIDDLMGATGATGPGPYKIALRDVLKDSSNQEGIAVSGANNTKPFHTDNTVFEDKAYPLIGRRLTANQGTADYDWDEMAVAFSQNGDMTDANDLVGMNAELPHQAKENGKIYPHIHWEQNSTNEVIFELDYRVQDNGAEKMTTWNRMVANSTDDSAFNYVSGTLNQITKFKENGVDYIDMDGIGISATLQFKITRTDSTGGVVNATFFDFHYEIDDLGSREEFIK